MPEFITVSQIATASGYSNKTIQRALENGELRGARHGERGHWRVDPSSAKRFLASCNAETPKVVTRVRRKKRASR